MKLLFFSDLHTDTSAATRIVNLAHGVDIAIGAGDFANSRRGLSSCVEILKQLKKPTVLVPGNNESYDELVGACTGWASAHALHGNGAELLGIPFFGIGGGIPITPFGSWSFDFSEEDATRLLKDCPVGAVLVSHSPPKGAVDQTSSGQSLGSRAVRDAIVRLQPRLVVCGHIHASGGQQATIGNTPVINAGPGGMVITV